MRDVNSAFQMRLADENLKVNLKAGCSNFNDNNDDSVKSKRYFHKSRKPHFLHSLQDSDMCALHFNYIVVDHYCVCIHCIVLNKIVMRHAPIILSIIWRAGGKSLCLFCKFILPVCGVLDQS